MVKWVEQWFADPLIWNVAMLRQWLETSQTPYKPPQVSVCLAFFTCIAAAAAIGRAR